jgi:hypothetical protein
MQKKRMLGRPIVLFFLLFALSSVSLRAEKKYTGIKGTREACYGYRCRYEVLAVGQRQNRCFRRGIEAGPITGRYLL